METWELAELYDIPITIFWMTSAALLLATFANVAVRMWRLRRPDARA